MGIIRCTCCNAEITAPQFFNGLPYGYTCIKKVSKQKQIKRQMVKADSFKVTEIEGSTRCTITAIVGGKRVSDWGYKDLSEGFIKAEKLVVSSDNQCFVYVN